MIAIPIALRGFRRRSSHPTPWRPVCRGFSLHSCQADGSASATASSVPTHSPMPLPGSKLSPSAVLPSTTTKRSCCLGAPASNLSLPSRLLKEHPELRLDDGPPHE